MEVNYDNVMTREEIKEKFPILDQALYRINKEAKHYRDIRNELISFVYNQETPSTETMKLLKENEINPNFPEIIQQRTTQKHWTRENRLPDTISEYRDLKIVIQLYSYVYIMSMLLRAPTVPEHINRYEELEKIIDKKVTLKHVDFRKKANKAILTNYQELDDDIIRVITMIFNDYDLTEKKIKEICNYNLVKLYRHIYNCFSGITGDLVFSAIPYYANVHNLIKKYKLKIEHIYTLKEWCIKYLRLEIVGWNLAYYDSWDGPKYCPLYEYGNFTFHGKPRTINTKGKNILDKDGLLVSAEIDESRCKIDYPEALKMIENFNKPFHAERERVSKIRAKERKEQQRLKKLEKAEREKRLKAERYFNGRINKKDLQARGWTVPLILDVFGKANKKTRYNLAEVLTYEKEHPELKKRKKERQK